MKLRKIVSFFISTLMMQGCVIARSEDVNRAASVYLREQFRQDFRGFRSFSTVNEGNMNSRGFRITAAPEREPRAVFSFSADCARGKRTPEGEAMPMKPPKPKTAAFLNPLQPPFLLPPFVSIPFRIESGVPTFSSRRPKKHPRFPAIVFTEFV